MIREQRRNKLLVDLHQDILDYGKLKRRWDLGRIELRLWKPRANLRLKGPPYRTQIYGWYFGTMHQSWLKTHLGNSCEHALHNFKRYYRKAYSSVFGPFRPHIRWYTDLIDDDDEN